MAIEVFLKPFVSINSIDLSDHVRSVSLPIAPTEVDSVVGGNTGMARLAGLVDWTLEVTFAQDFASAKVDATIGLIALTGEEVPIIVRKSTDAIGATNPAYNGSGRVFNYDPLGNTINDLAEAPVTLKASNGTLMTRTTA